MSSSTTTGNNLHQQGTSQNEFVSFRIGRHQPSNNPELVRGGHSKSGAETSSYCNTLSLDSWKTGGGNGDSGYTNRTSTTVPLNRNSINSSAATSAEFQNIPKFNNESQANNNSNPNTSSVSSYVSMPMPPGVHPQIGDVINSHHVLSPAKRNNICR